MIWMYNWFPQLLSWLHLKSKLQNNANKTGYGSKGHTFIILSITKSMRYIVHSQNYGHTTYFSYLLQKFKVEGHNQKIMIKHTMNKGISLLPILSRGYKPSQYGISLLAKDQSCSYIHVINSPRLLSKNLISSRWKS